MTEARVVRPGDLVPGPPTPGVGRLEAFAGEDRWIGRATSEPGVTSGWHHHGQHETYFYVLAGATRLDVAGSQPFEVRAGDFAYVPAGVVHRETSIADVTLDAIVVRIGSGPQVFPVDAPKS
jgi:quercetin dioxygenase-like cupin family protein